MNDEGEVERGWGGESWRGVVYGQPLMYLVKSMHISGQIGVRDLSEPYVFGAIPLDQMANISGMICYRYDAQTWPLSLEQRSACSAASSSHSPPYLHPRPETISF